MVRLDSDIGTEVNDISFLFGNLYNQYQVQLVVMPHTTHSHEKRVKKDEKVTRRNDSFQFSCTNVFVVDVFI